MKIFGIGVDIIDNIRIKRLIKNKLFIKRIYSSSEIKKSLRNKDKISYFSKRFAAKEALVKAFGTGFRKGINFKDIDIENDYIGKPYFVKSRKIDDFTKKIFKTKKYDIFLSISDEKKFSVAFVILYGVK